MYRCSVSYKVLRSWCADLFFFLSFSFSVFFFFLFVVAARAWSLLSSDFATYRIGMNDLVDRSLSCLVRIRFPCFVLRASCFASPHAHAISSFLSPWVEVCVEAEVSALLGTEVVVRW